jgi:hypothetical protein
MDSSEVLSGCEGAAYATRYFMSVSASENTDQLYAIGLIDWLRILGRVGCVSGVKVGSNSLSRNATNQNAIHYYYDC